ncbi:MAG: hypothetical protein K2P80_07425 [Beijerinckiaceae bacterium]|nr:hypothetical protein [Beijerinckiaceae bacterium]
MLALSEADQARIAETVRAAERTTSAEIVCAVAAGASEYRFTPVLWSSVVALLLPWPLWWLTEMQVSSILVLQLLVFCACLLILSWKPIRLRLTPRAIRRTDVERAAERQFHLLGIMRTRRRAGILVYVSLAERVAVILPDEAAREHLTLAASQAALAALTERLKRRELAEGFVSAIGILAEAMAPGLPAGADDVDELPNRVIEA